MGSLRRLLRQSIPVCSRELSSEQARKSHHHHVLQRPQLLTDPIPRDSPPVQELEHAGGRGEHYTRSYRQFTSWLNSGGHAEVYEGCLVVGRVVQVINKGTIDRENSMKLIRDIKQKTKLSELSDEGQNEANHQISTIVDRMENQVAQRERGFIEGDPDITAVLLVDWGHKHLGYAPLHDSVPSLTAGDMVVCKLLTIENVFLNMGHEVYERYNEAHLEYVRQIDREKTVECHPPAEELSPLLPDDTDTLLNETSETEESAPSDVSEEAFYLVRMPGYNNVFVRRSDKKLEIQTARKLDIFVDNKLTGLVIGKQGVNLKQIRQDMDVRCQFMSEDSSLLDGKRCCSLFSRKDDSIRLAVRRIDNIIEAFLEKGKKYNIYK